MNETHLTGLEGTNPLGFLAALGVQVVFSSEPRQPRLWWSDDVTPHAVVDGNFSVDQIADQALEVFAEWSRSPAVNPTRPDGSAMPRGDEAEACAHGHAGVSRSSSSIRFGRSADCGTRGRRKSGQAGGRETLRLLLHGRTTEVPGHGPPDSERCLTRGCTGGNRRSVELRKWTPLPDVGRERRSCVRPDGRRPRQREEAHQSGPRSPGRSWTEPVSRVCGPRPDTDARMLRELESGLLLVAAVVQTSLTSFSQIVAGACLPSPDRHGP